MLKACPIRLGTALHKPVHGPLASRGAVFTVRWALARFWQVRSGTSA
jgi:hypothetical protein